MPMFMIKYIAGSIFAFLLGAKLVEWHIKCSHSHIADLCKGYESGRITGGLCHELCTAKSINVHTCLTGQAEKRVHRATWRAGQEIVLKFESTYQSTTQIDESLDGRGDPLMVVTKQVLLMFGILDDKCDKCNDITEHLLHIADVDLDGALSVVEARSLLMLLSKPESAMLVILNGSRHALDLYGYCGGLYVTENIPVIGDNVFGMQMSLHDFMSGVPFVLEPVEEFIRTSFTRMYDSSWLESVLDPFVIQIKLLLYKCIVQKQVPTLEERFNFFLSLLDATLELNSNFLGLLQSCDTHIGNFGLSGGGVVKFIDLDLTYPKYAAEIILGAQSCDSDADCALGDFHECTSKCNSTSGFCEEKFKTQDLHNICGSMTTLFVFARDNFESHQEESYVCLIKAVGTVIKYCTMLPTYETAEELTLHLEKVKGMLESVKNGQYKCP